MPRAVVDAGVLIAAFLSPAGAPARLLLQWLAGRFDLIVSPAVLSELDQVLARPKLRRYATEAEARAYASALRRQAIMVDDPADAEPGLTPDPGDDYLVALARAARADVLVSGDPHLTALTDARPPVLTPKAFLNSLEPAQPS